VTLAPIVSTTVVQRASFTFVVVGVPAAATIKPGCVQKMRAAQRTPASCKKRGTNQQKKTQRKKKQGSMADPYAVLGVSRGATTDEIKKVFRKAALKCHPDKVQDANKQEAQSKFQELTQAYEQLMQKATSNCSPDCSQEQSDKTHQRFSFSFSAPFEHFQPPASPFPFSTPRVFVFVHHPQFAPSHQVPVTPSANHEDECVSDESDVPFHVVKKKRKRLGVLPSFFSDLQNLCL
jgi:hypothetical protein